MFLNQKIDCHTHIVNNKIKQNYFSQTSGYAVVMQFINAFTPNAPPDESFKTVQNDERLFLCPAIDLKNEIAPQLEFIHSHLNDTRIIGLKIYLTYQAGKADDDVLLPIYDFAKKHRLSITFHTGSCSLVLPSDNDMEGSNAKYIQNVAKQFPTVNFIIAHMDDPRFDECIRIVHETENLFTDFSGAYEPGTKEGADMDWAIETFSKAINQYPDTYRKILYGTDFCPPINLSAVEEYDVTIAQIFTEEQHQDIYYKNALRAFPKIKEYLNKYK